MTLAERGRKIEELGRACKLLAARSAEEEKRQKFSDVIDELNRTHPVSLEGNPAAKEALFKAVGELLDPQPIPRRRGRRAAQPAGNELAEGLLAAVKRADIEHVVEQLAKFVAHAKRHGGPALRNDLVDWAGRGLLRAISIVLPRGVGALDALERSFLVRLTGATYQASTAQAHLGLLRQAAARAQGADRQALLEARDRLASREGWKVHGDRLRKLFRGVAQALRPDDIAKHDKETAPQLVAHYQNEIARLKHQSAERAIPQTDTVVAERRPDIDATLAQRTGRMMGIEQTLLVARDRLEAAERALPGLQAEVTEARADVDRLKQRQTEDKARANEAAASAQERAERLKNLAFQSDQAWGEILKSPDILGLFDDPKTLARVVRRHVALTPKDMTDRLQQGQTAYVGSFRSTEAFLNALVEVAQIIHGKKDFEFEPGQAKVLQLKFPASSGWMRLRDGKLREVPKSMMVSVTLNEKREITHLHPDVRPEDMRHATGKSSAFSALA
jgi:hypothetical protein